MPAYLLLFFHKEKAMEYIHDFSLITYRPSSCAFCQRLSRIDSSLRTMNQAMQVDLHALNQFMATHSSWHS